MKKKSEKKKEKGHLIFSRLLIGPFLRIDAGVLALRIPEQVVRIRPFGVACSGSQVSHGDGRCCCYGDATTKRAAVARQSRVLSRGERRQEVLQQQLLRHKQPRI